MNEFVLSLFDNPYDMDLDRGDKIMALNKKFKYTMIDKDNFHCWVLKDNGEVYDPHFITYDMIKAYHKIKKKRKPIRTPFKAELQREILKEIELKIERSNHNPRQIENFITNPVESFCWFNAYYYQQKYGGKIIIGRFGWLKEDGTIFYEYG